MNLPDGFQKRLRLALRGAFPTKGRLTVLVHDWKQESLDGISRDGDLDELIVGIVFAAKSDMENFLETAISLNAQPELISLRDELAGVRKNTPLSTKKPHTCLPRQRPMINRTMLHSHISTLKQSGCRILAISGGEKTGKTHSIKLISHHSIVADDDNKFHVVVIDLNEYGLGVTGRTIANALAAKIPLPDAVIPPIGPEQDSTWSSQCCDILEGSLRRYGKNLWIVIDGLRRYLLPGTRVFLECLAKRVDTSLDNVRLVLIDFPESLPAVNCLKENLQEVTLEELQNFLVQAHEELGLPADPAKLAAMALAIWKQLDRSDKTWMQSLHESLCTVLGISI